MKLLSADQRVTIAGIFIVSLQNKVFFDILPFLNYGHYLGFMEKLQSSCGRRLCRNSSWDNAATPFFAIAAVSYMWLFDINYIAESIASWEKESGSVDLK